MRDEGPQPARRRRRTRRADIPSSPGCANYITGVTLSITTECSGGGGPGTMNGGRFLRESFREKDFIST